MLIAHRALAAPHTILLPTKDDDILMTINKITPWVYGDPTTIYAVLGIPSNQEFDRG